MPVSFNSKRETTQIWRLNHAESCKIGFDKPVQIPRVLPALDGVVAQLVERLNGIQEVASSILVGSTILSRRGILRFDGTSPQIWFHSFPLSYSDRATEWLPTFGAS